MNSVKTIIERMIPVGAIFSKLLKGEHLVWPGLNTCNRIFELNHKTLKALYLLARMNFASVLIIKSMAGMISPEKIVFLVQLAKFAVYNAEEAAEYWRNADKNHAQKEMLLHSEMSLKFYQIVAYYAIIRCNLYEKDGMMVKKKTYNQIIWENHLLCDEVEKLTKDLVKTKIDSKMSPCFKQNQVFVPDFVNFYMNYHIEESKKTFGYLKDSINDQIMSSADQILDYVASTNDFIDKVFEKYC